MTKKELIEKIADLPDNAEVVAYQSNGHFTPVDYVSANDFGNKGVLVIGTLPKYYGD